VSSLLTSNSQRGTGSSVADRGGKLEFIVDLVVKDGSEIVVQSGFQGGIDLAAGPVGFEFFGFQRAIESETDRSTEVGRTVREDGISVQRTFSIGGGVEINFVVAPSKFDFVQTWDWASGNWPAGACSDFSDVVVFDFDVGGGFGWIHGFLDGELWADLVFDFQRRGNGVTFKGTFGGEFKSIRFAAEFDFVVSVLETFAEEVVTFLGEIAVFDWHG